MASLEIEVDVNESYIARVTPGQKVVATLDAYPEWQIPSRVRTVIPTADRQKATVKVRISFDKLDPRILPDMGVKVAFLGEQQPAGQAAARALVPREAVREREGKQVVFLYHDGVVERRAVSLGSARGSDLEIMAGVSPGDQVVVEGSRRAERRGTGEGEVGKRQEAIGKRGRSTAAVVVVAAYCLGGGVGGAFCLLTGREVGMVRVDGRGTATR